METARPANLYCAAGSLPGREHTRLHRNNQDGVAIRIEGERIAAVVTDGCSSGRCSEVGARLGAAWIAAWLPALANEIPPSSPDRPAELARRLGERLERHLRQLAASIDPDPAGRSLPDTVADYLLFTFLAALVEPEQSVVIGLGDGLWAINGDAVVLDPGPENAPPYLAYRLVPPDRLDDSPAASLDPVVHWSGSTAALESLILASDGASDLDAHGGLEPFATDPAVLLSPFSVQRRLVSLRENHRALEDDTTVVLIRRRNGRADAERAEGAER